MTDGRDRTHSRPRVTPARGVAALCALAVALTGCSDDGTGPNDGDETGTMQTAARDGGGASEQGGHAAFDLGAQTEGDVSGQVTGQATVEVQTETGAWQEIGTLADMSMNAELRSEGSSSMGSAEVEARTYDGVRIVLEDVEADVEAGSDLGVGPIDVSVSVAIAGGSQVVVEHNAPFTVQADGTAEVTLDLNSHVWLDEESVEAETVTAAEFESAATILVE